MIHVTILDLTVNAFNFLNLVCKLELKRNRTSTIVIMYSLYLYFLGLSLRNTSKVLTIFKDQKRSYVSVWN